jgi:hypothetical protein
MKQVQTSLVVALLAMSVYLGGCSSQIDTARKAGVEHYRSAQVEGESAKINLDEVQKAFWETKGKDAKDFDGWMHNFEKRVNEIYDGKEVVSIDATRESGKLVVTGYIDKLKKEGFQPGDEKLFSIEQTGDAVNNEMPYTVNTGAGTPYYTGHHSLLDSPIVQMMLISHMMGGWGGRYYTPYPRTSILGGYRDTFRASPSYSTQQASNTSFMSRFKSKPLGGGFMSKTGFGGGSFSSDTSQRRTFGSASGSTESGSAWGGRRSSGGIFGSSSGGGFRSRGWGGRRR